MPFKKVALEFAATLPRCRRHRDVLDALHRATTSAMPALNVLGAWRLPRRPANFHRGRVQGRNLYFHSSLPAGYWREFLRKVRRNGPSILANLAWSQIGPFTFTDGMRLAQPIGIDRWIFDHLDQFGIRDGLYCPIGRWMVVYWSQQVLHLSNEQRNLLYFMAVVAAARMDEINVMVPSRNSNAPQLSARELAVLRHMSYGASEQEIAEQLELRTVTVRTYVHRAMEKLAAKTREHAVSEALRMRLIS